MLEKIIFKDIVDSQGFQLVWEFDNSTNIATFDGTVIDEMNPEEKLTPRGSILYPSHYSDGLSVDRKTIDLGKLSTNNGYQKIDDLIKTKDKIDDLPTFWSSSARSLTPPPIPPRPDKPSTVAPFTFEAIVNEKNIEVWRKVGVYLSTGKDESNPCHMNLQNQIMLEKFEESYIYYTNAQLYTYLGTNNLSELVNSKKLLIEHLKKYINTLVAPLVGSPEGEKHSQALKKYFSLAINSVMDSEINNAVLRLEELSENEVQRQYEYLRDPQSQWERDLDEERNRRATLVMRLLQPLESGKTMAFSDEYDDALVWLNLQIDKEKIADRFKERNDQLKKLIIESGIEQRSYMRKIEEIKRNLKNIRSDIRNFTRLSTLIHTFVPQKDPKQELAIRLAVINELKKYKLSLTWCPRIEDEEELYLWKNHAIHKELNVRLTQTIDDFFKKHKSSRKSLDWKKFSKWLVESIVDTIVSHEKELQGNFQVDDKNIDNPIAANL